ncbi:MAG TPA: polysaccharide biosynthesis tyrosine autokinase [Vicinamibacteria bacterium]|nr:polysaccharide biosynthesis tyrosine autokinase [Vicinamibacteria bacterium]
MKNDSTPLTSDFEGFDLQYGLRLLWSGKPTILAMTLVGVGLGFLVTYMQVPIYRSQALVQIDPPSQNISALSNPYPTTALNWFDYQNYYRTQYRIIESKVLAEKVVFKLKLNEEAPFKQATDPAALFVSHVSVVPLPDTRLAQIAIMHQDPKLATLWANTLAEAYVEQNLETKIETTRNIYSWLQERLGSAQNEVARSEEKLYEYTEKQDLFIPEEGQSIVSGTLEKLNEAYTDAKTRRIELESMLSQIQSLKRSGQSLEAQPQVSEDPLVRNLNMQRAGLEVDLVKVQDRYKEGHPQVKKLRSQVEQIQSAIDAQAEKIVAGIQAEYQQIRRREQELLASVNEHKKESFEEGRKTVQMEMLQRETVSNKNLYEVILQKIKETDVAASLWSNNVSIIEEAVVPTAPISPNPRKNLALALVAGLVLGCGIVFLRDHLDNTIKEQEDVETHLHTDCLTIVPMHENAEEGVVTEAYRSLRTALLFSRESEQGNVVLITSSVPQEGKSTTALHTARALAASGEPTLLIDFDLRRGDLYSRLKLSREPGMSDYCLRDLQVLSSIVQPTRFPNLSLVTAGKRPPNPPAFIGTPAVKRLLEEARQRFTWILLDAPPIAGVTDPILLAKLADMVVMVVRSNAVDRKLARRCLNSLRKTKARLVGVVLNGVDPKQDSYHRYYSYYHSQRGPQSPKVTPINNRPVYRTTPRPRKVQG